ncbi:MAG: hypothetical protein M8841_06345 [marine benthic group bacterium]|nr:hypothetical protein [Gemmatimonadota bacterium]MCL7938203.1 hypothetical protein [Gemmatimonadota bacterium]MCL7964657.1 hypothetical protein [Gemmatimonadota bacterium]MCL7983816.1 hypothetical protein [Gemmatimonadota bacterium]
MFLSGVRRRTLCWLLAWAAAVVPVVTAPVAAQETRGAGSERGVADVRPDTVRVGEGFELALTAVSGERVKFPALLTLPDDVEQTGPPSLDDDGEGTWRAVYPLVAWTTGRRQLPAVLVPVIGGREERILEIRPPGITVASVLPADSEPVRLLPPRVPENGRRIPWPWLLALLLAALLAREILRARRAPPVPPPASEEIGLGPYEEARERLQRLRQRASEGSFEAAALYDEVESIIRHFLVRTREWPEARPVRQAFGVGMVGSDPAVVRETAEMMRAVRRALPARFGALEVSREALLTDVDSVLAWLSRDEAA